MAKRRFRAEENESDFTGLTVLVSGAKVENVLSIRTKNMATIIYQLQDPATKTPLEDANGEPVLGTMAVKRDTIEIVEP